MRKIKNILSKKDAGWWVAKLFENKEVNNNFDRGIFSIYFFNIVHLHKGQGVFSGRRRAACIFGRTKYGADGKQ